MSEWLVILVVAVLVFTPDKLPMVAQHLGKLWKHLQFFKAQAGQFWQQQMNEYQLKENQKKAQDGDKLYENKAPSPQMDD